MNDPLDPTIDPEDFLGNEDDDDEGVPGDTRWESRFMRVARDLARIIKFAADADARMSVVLARTGPSFLLDTPELRLKTSTIQKRALDEVEVIVAIGGFDLAGAVKLAADTASDMADGAERINFLVLSDADVITDDAAMLATEFRRIASAGDGLAFDTYWVTYAERAPLGISALKRNFGTVSVVADVAPADADGEDD